MAKAESGNYISTADVKEALAEVFNEGTINEEQRAVIVSRLLQRQEFVEIKNG